MYTLLGTPRPARTPGLAAGGRISVRGVLGFSLGAREGPGYILEGGCVYAGNRGVRVSLAYINYLPLRSAGSLRFREI